MYEKVLVTLDGSETSETVLPYVEELARSLGSDLSFISVCPEHERNLDRIWREHLEDLAGRFKAKGLTARAVFTYGNPVEEILRYAHEIGANLIAMSTHGRSGFVEWTVGGVAEKVLIRARVPLLLIPGKRELAGTVKSGKFERILVPLAISESGPNALPWAKELARRTGAKLFLFHVIPSTHKVVGVLDHAVDFERQLVAALRRRADEYMAGIAADLKKDKIDFQSDLATGVPLDAMLDYVKDHSIDLIAMSTHGRTGASRVILGSVTHQIVHSSAAPVLVVRP